MVTFQTVKVFNSSTCESLQNLFILVVTHICWSSHCVCVCTWHLTDHITVVCCRMTPSPKKISLQRCITCFWATSALGLSWTTSSLMCKDHVSLSCLFKRLSRLQRIRGIHSFKVVWKTLYIVRVIILLFFPTICYSSQTSSLIMVVSHHWAIWLCRLTTPALALKSCHKQLISTEKYVVTITGCDSSSLPVWPLQLKKQSCPLAQRDSDHQPRQPASMTGATPSHKSRF